MDHSHESPLRVSQCGGGGGHCHVADADGQARLARINTKTGGMDMLAHWIWLATRPGIGVRSALMLLRAFPNIEALFYAGREDYALVEGADSRHLEALCDKSLGEANRDSGGLRG